MSEPALIEAVVREVREKAIWVADGTEVDWQDPRTGEIIKRERRFWLPKSKISVDPEDYEVGDTVMITVPAWLAENKELV